MAAGQYPEAQVAFDAVLLIDPANARARERLDVALQRTGESLLARWLPDQLPLIQFLRAPGDRDRRSHGQPPGPCCRRPGHCTRRVLRGRSRRSSEVVPAPSRDVAQRGSLGFQREFPLVPGPNEITVTATDNGGQEQSETLRLERRLRIWETRLFMPSAVLGALGLLGAGFVVQRVRRRHALRRRFNPYIAGAPVLDDDMIFGREKLLQRILNVLHHNSLMITGERRIGKTTFLYHLKKHLETEDTGDYRFFPVFTDLQGVPETGLFHALMSDIVEQLKPTEEALDVPALPHRRSVVRRKGLQPRPAARSSRS